MASRDPVHIGMSVHCPQLAKSRLGPWPGSHDPHPIRAPNVASSVDVVTTLGSAHTLHSIPKAEYLPAPHDTHSDRASLGASPAAHAVHVFLAASTTLGNTHTKHSPDAEKSSVLRVYTQLDPAPSTQSLRSPFSVHEPSSASPAQRSALPSHALQSVRSGIGPSPG